MREERQCLFLSRVKHGLGSRAGGARGTDSLSRAMRFTGAGSCLAEGGRECAWVSGPLYTLYYGGLKRSSQVQLCSHSVLTTQMSPTATVPWFHPDTSHVPVSSHFHGATSPCRLRSPSQAVVGSGEAAESPLGPRCVRSRTAAARPHPEPELL